MNRPAGSSPTAAASATRSPSRAAPSAGSGGHPPISSEIPSTSFSCWPKAGVTSPPTTITSGLQSPMTSRSNGRPPAGPRSGGDNLDPGIGVDPVHPEKRDVQDDLVHDARRQRAP